MFIALPHIPHWLAVTRANGEQMAKTRLEKEIKSLLHCHIFLIEGQWQEKMENRFFILAISRHRASVTLFKKAPRGNKYFDMLTRILNRAYGAPKCPPKHLEFGPCRWKRIQQLLLPARHGHGWQAMPPHSGRLCQSTHSDYLSRSLHLFCYTITTVSENYSTCTGWWSQSLRAISTIWEYNERSDFNFMPTEIGACLIFDLYFEAEESNCCTLKIGLPI